MDSGLGINQQFSQDSRDSTASTSMDSGVDLKQGSSNTSANIKCAPKVKFGETFITFTRWRGTQLP